jgi:hypothetical protein
VTNIRSHGGDGDRQKTRRAEATNRLTWRLLPSAVAAAVVLLAATLTTVFATGDQRASAAALTTGGGPPGQSYYCGLGQVVAASRLCSDPNFFPISVWQQTPASPTDMNLPAQGFANEAAAAKYAHINMFSNYWNGYGLANDPDGNSTAAAAAEGIYTESGDPASLQAYLDSGNQAEAPWVIGYHLADEAACGNSQDGQPANIVPLVQATKAADPSRYTSAGEGSGAIDPGLIGGGASCVAEYEANFNAPDITSADYYALTDEYHGVVCSHDCLHEYGDFATASRAWNQDKKPFWEAVETGTNIGGGGDLAATSGSDYPQQEATFEQVNSAAWDSIINGARGIGWFCDQFYNDTQTDSSLYAAGTQADYDACLDEKPLRDNLSYVDGTIDDFASVLNSPWISGGFSNKSSNVAVPMAEMVKQVNGVTYIFAMTNRSGSTTATFSTPSLANQRATVVYDSNARYNPSANECGKTFGIDSSGSFSDTYPGNASDTTDPGNYSVRIYKIGGTGSDGGCGGGTTGGGTTGGGTTGGGTSGGGTSGGGTSGGGTSGGGTSGGGTSGGGGATNPLSIATTSLPKATAGSPYHATLAAVGGTSPVTWSASGLPSGLSLDPDTGSLSGIPNGPAGTAQVQITATDSSAPAPQKVSLELSLTVEQPSSPTPSFEVETSGYGTLVSPPISTNAGGELLVALVSSDGPVAVPQSVSISGAGLNWSLARRVDSQAGDAEVWVATAQEPLSNATVSSTQDQTGFFGQELTVVGFSNSHISSTAGASGPVGAPSVSVSSAPGSVIYGVGHDWDAAIPRSPAAGQKVLSEWPDTQTADDNWAQSAPAAGDGPTDLADTSPTTDRWDMAAVAVSSGSGTSGSGAIIPAAPDSTNPQVRPCNWSSPNDQTRARHCWCWRSEHRTPS